MDRELMEQILSRLPAPCDPMTERRQAAWIRLVQAVLDFCYCDEGQPPAGTLLALSGPTAAPVVEPAVMPVELLEPENPAPRRTNYFGKKGNPGKSSPLVSAVRQAFSSQRTKPLSKKDVVDWLEKNRKSDLAHLVNVGSSVYQCVKKMEDRRELESGERDGVTVWRLMS